MSYCRWSDGDVYVVSGPPLCCHCCRLLTPGPLNTKNEDFVGTKVEMLLHLREHLAAGHAFPIWAIERLEAEIEEEARTGKESSFYLRRLPTIKTYGIWKDGPDYAMTLYSKNPELRKRTVAGLQMKKPKLALVFRARSWKNAKKRLDKLMNS